MPGRWSQGRRDRQAQPCSKLRGGFDIESITTNMGSVQGVRGEIQNHAQGRKARCRGRGGGGGGGEGTGGVQSAKFVTRKTWMAPPES